MCDKQFLNLFIHLFINDSTSVYRKKKSVEYKQMNLHTSAQYKHCAFNDIIWIKKKLHLPAIEPFTVHTVLCNELRVKKTG